MTSNPTAMGRWAELWEEMVPESTLLPFTNTYVIGPFDHTDYRGYDAVYPPEQWPVPVTVPDTGLTAIGKDDRELHWRPAASLSWTFESPLEISSWMVSHPWSVIYIYAEVEVEEAQPAELRFAGPDDVIVWSDEGEASAWRLTYAPAIPGPADPEVDARAAAGRALVGLRPGTTRFLFKLMYPRSTWHLQMQVAAYGDPEPILRGIERVAAGAPDPTTRIVARYSLIEVAAAMGDARSATKALDALRADPLATRWDLAWADAVEAQAAASGTYMPIRDVALAYAPVTSVAAYETFWPQSSAPAERLWVIDVSARGPEMEFAMGVLQGLVNRETPRLYLLHSRYARQDRLWLDELVHTGYTYRRASPGEIWDEFLSEVRGAILYDPAIMDEIGAYRSDQLNQTNVLMMIAALEQALPVTPEMNEPLGLPVVFDARGKWANQYDMMRWAYTELFPRMNQRILATNYPGIFLLTDYLVQHQIFTFWFPEHRTLPEENLLRGILASTPPNTPIVGWWFDWMPTPQDPAHQAADAVMETPGLLRGSYFGKVLTPSHEATNLSVHSGVAIGPWVHKTPATPKLDPSKVYYAHVISDGDNLGEALMMRTRDLQWDRATAVDRATADGRPERGSVPMGWSFAPAAARLAPPVLNYYLRTATHNDLLVGGLGIGYTEPDIYLRAYPEQREALYADYTALTNESLKWIDTNCLWLIRGSQEAEDRYARGTDGQLRGIFNGYGGSPEQASMRVGPNDVVIFRPATSMSHGEPREVLIETMVNEIREAAGTARPAFVEAWVLNWAWSMDMLEEVRERLGDEFVAVRPDVLVELTRR